ncbi:MAG: FkbM family methyltransferase [Nitrospirales bacterium]
MKILPKKNFKPLKKYWKSLLSNKRSRIVRPLYLFYDLFLKQYGRKYYSQFGEDIALEHLFGEKVGGFYVDIGCFHPKHWSNTYLLHKRHWKGLNIDLDEQKIQAFNFARKNSVNICTAISEEEKEMDVYLKNTFSPLNTLEKEFAEEAESILKKPVEYTVQRIKTRTLNSILMERGYGGREIDLLSIDVEGHELSVLKSLNFEEYRPKVLVVELHAKKIEHILESDLYRFVRAKHYVLHSWHQPSLIFVKNSNPN